MTTLEAVRQQVTDHIDHDTERFGWIFKILGAAAAAALALGGWSLKTQYEVMHTAQTSAQAQLEALWQIQAKIENNGQVPKPTRP